MELETSMDLQDSFDFEATQQAENLERVSSRIARAIVTFCSEHKRFHADELRKFVIDQTGIAAPASADRVLRNLRQRGWLDYKILSRSESLYEIIWVKP
jgi:hypothetical protein